ncbi:phosphotransferase family protein [Tateyamaria sp.]|uniref:phosphotransferase family protein n=1 Tax=Tateyamaria sp. TaxID=1929288 RepID=UPI00329FEBD1
MKLEERCKALVAELGLAKPNEVDTVEPLTGGVASDIAMVDLGHRKVCVKFALPKLKVAEDWHAPVHRNATEYAWLQVASEAFPDSAIQLFGRSGSDHGFAMEYLEGDDIYLWKANLLSEAKPKGEAVKVAHLLGSIHAISATKGFDRQQFRNRDDFRALRIEPYLSFSRKRHPSLSKAIHDLEVMLYESQTVLVHGDASPKNILFRDGSPILLDAECATMGDACFDPAFCLNHLVLKAIHLSASRQTLMTEFAHFWTAYRPLISWENPDLLEQRVCALIPILMLARVDGKSPVEYLSEDDRGVVRTISKSLIALPPTSIEQFSNTLAKHLPEESS